MSPPNCDDILKLELSTCPRCKGEDEANVITELHKDLASSVIAHLSPGLRLRFRGAYSARCLECGLVEVK